MEDYQLRVVDKKKELDEKIERLSTFVSGRNFEALEREERVRMGAQLNSMREYSAILGERINAFRIPQPINKPYELALNLCLEIEKLPGSEQQTKVAVLANELLEALKK